MSTKAIVLGSAAGGGFPQWNCRCAVCQLAWANDPRVKPRTQASLAIGGEQGWLLVNASPDLGLQIRSTVQLHPQKEGRDTPIDAVLLTGAEIDQTAGLLQLRERQAFDLFATAATMAALEANPIFSALDEDIVVRHVVGPGDRLSFEDRDIELFNLPGKPPLYLEETVATNDGEYSIGLTVGDGGKRLLYAPGSAAITPDLYERIAAVDIALFDGTVFTDDELIVAGVGKKTGRRMGHVPISGDKGSLMILAANGSRRIYTHINNTNPILVEGSPQRREVESRGWEVAFDGMEIAL